jgi:hypothetical protein
MTIIISEHNKYAVVSYVINIILSDYLYKSNIYITENKYR